MYEAMVTLILIILFFGIYFAVTKNAVLAALEEFHEKHK